MRNTSSMAPKFHIIIGLEASVPWMVSSYATVYRCCISVLIRGYSSTSSTMGKRVIYTSSSEQMRLRGLSIGNGAALSAEFTDYGHWNRWCSCIWHC